MSMLVTDVRATDRDLSGRIKHEIIDDGLTPIFFSINQYTGHISVNNGSLLKEDRSVTYTVRICHNGEIPSNDHCICLIY